MVKVTLCAAMLALLAACAQTSGGQYCDIADPIRPTPEDVDVISDRLVTQILSHNNVGADLCGWEQ